ncbi:hypothetical protein Tco_1316246 [Tanacetum coccineum]
MVVLLFIQSQPLVLLGLCKIAKVAILKGYGEVGNELGDVLGVVVLAINRGRGWFEVWREGVESTSLFPIPDSNSFFEKSDTSLSYSDNSLPEFESFSDHTEETSSGSTTTHANNSLPEYDSFHFEIEPDQGGLTSVVMEDILGEPRVHVPNVLPTHPTLMMDSDVIIRLFLLFSLIRWTLLFLSLPGIPQGYEDAGLFLPPSSDSYDLLLILEFLQSDHVKMIENGTKRVFIGCALWRKKLKEVWFTTCHENGINQDLLNTSESSDDDTNVVNAPREPFVVKQDPGENSSQSPPQINHNCCYECGDSLDGIFCQQCTCKSCGKGAHIGYNCPPKAPIISNPEPCNQTIDELPQTLPSFDTTCYSEKENSLPYVSKPNFVDDSPNVFNPPPQPHIYSCEFCGNDARYGHYCTPQVPFIYPEPCYNQGFNFSQDFHDFQQQYPCCEDCGGPHETFQCQS